MEGKERQRYILFEVLAEGEVGEKSLIRAVWRTLTHLYGDVGASKTGLWLVEYEKSQYGIIRTNIQSLPMIRATLAVIRTIEGKDCILAIQGVSGTIKALKKKHLYKITSDSQ